MIRPTGMPSAVSSAIASRRLLYRHLLQQRDHVHRGHRRAQQRRHALALGLDRADLGQPGGLRGDVEEAPDPAGRRRVEHHRVVDPAAVRGAGRRLLDLAGEQHVAQARGDRGGEVDRADLAQRPARRRRACRTCRGTPAAPPRRRRPAPAPRRRRAAVAMPPLLVRQRAAARTAGRCPAAPRPRPAGCAGRRRPGRGRARRRRVVLPVPPLPVTTCRRAGQPGLTCPPESARTVAMLPARGRRACCRSLLSGMLIIPT